MVAGSLLETLASIAIQTIAVAGLGALCATSAAIAIAAAESVANVEGLAHVEHLVDAAAARSGSGPGARANRPAIHNTGYVELLADLDYDGRVEPTSKEETKFSVSRGTDGRGRLILRIGRQSVAIGPPFDRKQSIEQGLVLHSDLDSPPTHWFAVPFMEMSILAVARRPVRP